MKKVSLTFALAVFLLQPIFVSAEETCVELNAPVTSVTDFDANGIVNGRDIAILAKTIRKNKRISRGNRAIEKSNHRSRHHRGFKSRNSRHSRKPQEIVYSPIFDRNADGDVDIIDLFMATRDMGKSSTQEDQKLATISNEILAGTYSCVEAVEVVEVVEDSASDCLSEFDADYCQYINSQ